MQRPARKFFVTGTDTDCGKTLVACALLRAGRQAGLSTAAIKPVAAGGSSAGGELRNDDALRLQAECTLDLEYSVVNPVCLPEPLSPHIAAARVKRRLSLDRLTGFCQGMLLHRADLTLIEGAGGWRVPLNDRELLSDLARALKIPVILVVGMKLGCLNHALLTAEAIYRDGLSLAGWVANGIDPGMQCRDENIATLREALPAPMLAAIPFLADPDDLDQAASYVKAGLDLL